MLSRERAFTLVELLTVLAVIAVLAALCMTAVQAVRERGDAAQCVSNLRQLALANLTYAAENGGQYVLAQESNNRIRWHGVRSSGREAFDPSEGPLSRYLGKDGRVKLCPSLKKVLKGSDSFEEGTGGYGYNATYIGGTPGNAFVAERMQNVPSPTRVVMFADCAFPRADGLQEYAYAEPWQSVDYKGRLQGELSPSVHFRHQRTANVAWCDGHVSPESPTRIGSTNGYGGNAGKWQIGWFGPEDENGWWNPQRTVP